MSYELFLTFSFAILFFSVLFFSFLFLYFLLFLIIFFYFFIFFRQWIQPLQWRIFVLKLPSWIKGSGRNLKLGWGSCTYRIENLRYFQKPSSACVLCFFMCHVLRFRYYCSWHVFIYFFNLLFPCFHSFTSEKLPILNVIITICYLLSGVQHVNQSIWIHWSFNFLFIVRT